LADLLTPLLVANQCARRCAIRTRFASPLNLCVRDRKRRDRERKERTFVIPGPWQPGGQAEDVDPEELVLR
jgi:hypothetical protein